MKYKKHKIDNIEWMVDKSFFFTNSKTGKINPKIFGFSIIKPIVPACDDPKSLARTIAEKALNHAHQTYPHMDIRGVLLERKPHQRKADCEVKMNCGLLMFNLLLNAGDQLELKLAASESCCNELELDYI